MPGVNFQGIAWNSVSLFHKHAETHRRDKLLLYEVDLDDFTRTGTIALVFWEKVLEHINISCSPVLQVQTDRCPIVFSLVMSRNSFDLSGYSSLPSAYFLLLCKLLSMDHDHQLSWNAASKLRDSAQAWACTLDAGQNSKLWLGRCAICRHDTPNGIYTVVNIRTHRTVLFRNVWRIAVSSQGIIDFSCLWMTLSRLLSGARGIGCSAWTVFHVNWKRTTWASVLLDY